MDRIDIFDSHFHCQKGQSANGIAGLLDGGKVCGILCCTDLHAPHDQFEARNQPLLELATQRGKDVLPLLAAVHLNRPNWANHASKWFDRYNVLVGIKLHPPISGYTLTPELLDGLFDFAGERGLLVASHTVPLPELSAGAFHPSLRRRPETRLVIYHGSTHEQSAYLAESFPNVYVEPSWLGFFPNLFQLMRKLGGHRKMLAGTDGPGWFDSFDGCPYEDLVQLARQNLPNEEAVRDFCARNARRLLGISD